MNEVQVKYSPPSKYEVAKFGTIYKVIGDSGDGIKIYVQTSENESNPSWRLIEDLLLDVFYPILLNSSFIDACLKTYIQPKHFKEIAKTLEKINPEERTPSGKKEKEKEG